MVKKVSDSNPDKSQMRQHCLPFLGETSSGSAVKYLSCHQKDGYHKSTC